MLGGVILLWTDNCCEGAGDDNPFDTLFFKCFLENSSSSLNSRFIEIFLVIRNVEMERTCHMNNVIDIYININTENCEDIPLTASLKAPSFAISGTMLKEMRPSLASSGNRFVKKSALDWERTVPRTVYPFSRSWAKT